jgi:AcrR family transcriptional regulator
LQCLQQWLYDVAMVLTGEPGLRERKRVRTRATIARAALELFDRQGFGATTIQEIADAADVSPRTVSHYFPRKEDLVFPDSDAVFASLEQRLERRPAGETMATALRGWFDAWLAEQEERAEERRARHRVIASDDALRAYGQRHTLRARSVVARAIARDLGVEQDAIEARMVAAATLALFEVIGEDAGAEVAPAEALALIDRALRFVDGGVAALRTGF